MKKDVLAKHIIEESISDSCMKVKNELLSLKEILELGKKRYELKQLFFKKYLLSDIRSAKNPNFELYKYRQDNAIIISFSLNENFEMKYDGPRVIRILYKDGKFTLYDKRKFKEVFKSPFEKMFIETKMDTLEKTVLFGLENQYNKELKYMKTEWYDYRVSLNSDELNISLNSELLTFLNRHFSLLYRFNQQNYLLDKKVKTDLGTFKLNTNIVGLKEHLEAKYNDSQLLIELLDSLYVDNSTLKTWHDKVKSL